MIRYAFSLLLVILLAVVVQQFIPALTGLYGSRVLLVLLVFLCASVSVPPPLMMGLAFICGLLADAQNTIGPHGGDPDVYHSATESLRFGHSIILYGLIGLLMQGIKPLFRQGKWQISSFLTGIAVFLFLVTDYLFINFVRGDFSFGKETLLKITLSSVVTATIAPLVFWILFRLAEQSTYFVRFYGLTRKADRGLSF